MMIVVVVGVLMLVFFENDDFVVVVLIDYFCNYVGVFNGWCFYGGVSFVIDY